MRKPTMCDSTTRNKMNIERNVTPSGIKGGIILEEAIL